MAFVNYHKVILRDVVSLLSVCKVQPLLNSNFVNVQGVW